LVDDDPQILEVFSELLRLKDYEVWAAGTGGEGLRLTRERRPDLVLLDVRLPDLSGFEVCRRIKTDPALQDVFVVLLSGEATSPAQKAGGLDTGADEYLTKPIDGQELLARIRTVARLQETTAALRAGEQHYRRLTEEMRQFPRRIIEAQEAERLRVARELHDGVNQLIASAKMRLRKLEDNILSPNPVAREMLARCNELLVQALEENRRIAYGLRPADLDELGLAAACRNLIQELRLRSNLSVRCDVARLRRRLPPSVELDLFRIAQEAVSNSEKHARAKTIRLRLAPRGGAVLLSIQDDGRGFDLKEPRSGKGKRRGLGLTNMRERAAALGGTCEVACAPGQGTTITVVVPVMTNKAAREK
jgi:signal transduction histidine kinase